MDAFKRRFCSVNERFAKGLVSFPLTDAVLFGQVLDFDDGGHWLFVIGYPILVIGLFIMVAGR